MTQLAVQVSDAQKAALLIELLSALDFVDGVTITNESNGVEEAYPRPYCSPQRAQMLQEEAAFDAMLPELLRHYPNEFVAVVQQQVVDHDHDEVALAKRVHERYPDPVILIRPVLDQPEPPLIFRSPRFIR
jgi:hypothetical protein